MRYLRLKHLLDEVAKSTVIEFVAFEEVRRHRGVDAAHVYGGIVSTLGSWAEERQIPYAGVPVGTIKKRATGKGNADKDQMVEAAQAQWPDFEIEDDNHADALWILTCAEDGLV